MTERRVAQIVGEAQRLGQIFVEPKRPGHRPPDLRHLDRVRKANPEMIAIGRHEYLCLVAKPAKGNRMDDPVAVALEGIARTPRPSIVLAEGPAARFCRVRGEGLGKRHLEEIFSILILAGVRVQLKPSTPSLASLFTKSCASPLLSNGPTSRRK